MRPNSMALDFPIRKLLHQQPGLMDHKQMMAWLAQAT